MSSRPTGSFPLLLQRADTTYRQYCAPLFTHTTFQEEATSILTQGDMDGSNVFGIRIVVLVSEFFTRVGNGPEVVKEDVAFSKPLFV